MGALVLVDTVVITAIDSAKVGSPFEVIAPDWTIAFDYTKGAEVGIDAIALQISPTKAFTNAWTVYYLESAATINLQVSQGALTATTGWANFGLIAGDSTNIAAKMPVGNWVRLVVDPNGALGNSTGSVACWVSQQWSNKNQAGRNN